MEKSKRGGLLYEELKSDEKTLIQWYRENLFLYILKLL